MGVEREDAAERSRHPAAWWRELVSLWITTIAIAWLGVGVDLHRAALATLRAELDLGNEVPVVR